MSYELSYKPGGPVARDFIRARDMPVVEGYAPKALKPIHILRGPIGGGKTVACCIRLFLHMAEQPIGPDGWRRSRWAVVRNTNPQLETTTIKTWLEWFPEQHFGQFRWAKPYLHRFRFPAMKIDAEVWFFPLDDERQVRMLLGLELTGVLVNEVRETPRRFLVDLRSRVGRYPREQDGGWTWAGVIGDTNSPEEEHYLAYWEGATPLPDWLDESAKLELAKPDGVKIYVQPGGLLPIRDKRLDGRPGKVTGWRENPRAENLKNLSPGYYPGQIPGNNLRWLLAMCGNEYGATADATVVYSDFDEGVHVSLDPIEWKGGRLLLGADFARHPAIVVAEMVDGQLRVLREFMADDKSTRAFVAEDFIPAMNVLFPGWAANYRGWGDPSGRSRTGGDDTTMFSHAREAGVSLFPGWTNDFDKRKDAVEQRLTRLVRGQPAMLISPHCRMLITGFKGGYALPLLTPGQPEQGSADKPVKNIYSHPHDGLQYLCSNVDRGMGARPVPAGTRAPPNARPSQPFNPFAR